MVVIQIIVGLDCYITCVHGRVSKIVTGVGLCANVRWLERDWGRIFAKGTTGLFRQDVQVI